MLVLEGNLRDYLLSLTLLIQMRILRCQEICLNSHRGIVEDLELEPRSLLVRPESFLTFLYLIQGDSLNF